MPGKTSYSTSRTIVQRDVNRLVVVEDIFYGSGGKPPRVGGVRIQLAVRNPDGLKAYDVNVLEDTQTDVSLVQRYDVLYGGVVRGHVQVECDGPPDVDGVAPLSCMAWWDEPEMMPVDVFTCDLV